MTAPSRRPTSMERLALAIRRACEEHGRPNSFSPGELVEYGGPRPVIAGVLGRRYMSGLWSWLGGSQKWGSCPVYQDRRFFV